MGDEVRILSRAIDQAGDVLDHVHADWLGMRTPCGDWSLGELVDHLSAQPANFLAMMRGEQPDWTVAPPHVAEGWGPGFRMAGDDLIHRWHEHEGDSPVPADWQVAEIAVHTWDVAVAIDYPVERLDPEVAEVALAFMRENLTTENRGEAFAAEQPSDGGPYERLAAYAGRAV